MIGRNNTICNRRKKLRHLGCNFMSVGTVCRSALRGGVKIKKVAFGRKF